MRSEGAPCRVKRVFDPSMIRRITRDCLVAAVFLCLLLPAGPLVLAQETYGIAHQVPDKPGKWGPFSDGYPTPKSYSKYLTDWTRHPLSETEVRVVLDKLERICNVFRGLKPLSPPMGFDVRPRRFLGKFEPEDPVPGPIPCHLSLSLVEYLVWCKTCEPVLAGEGSGSIYVWANLIGLLYWGRGGWKMEDEHGPIFRAPSLVGHVAGFPIYDNDSDKWVVITKIKRPLWLPVSQERYIRIQIRFWQAELDKYKEIVAKGTPYDRWLKEEQKGRKEKEEEARRAEENYQKLKKSDPKATEEYLRTLAYVEQTRKEVGEGLKAGDPQQREHFRKGIESLERAVREHEAELASLSPAERAAPAYYTPGSKRPSGLGDKDAPKAQMLVETNKDFFEPGPATSFQLLLVDAMPTADKFEAYLKRGPYRVPASREDEASVLYFNQLLVNIGKELDWELFKSFLD